MVLNSKKMHITAKYMVLNSKQCGHFRTFKITIAKNQMF